MVVGRIPRLVQATHLLLSPPAASTLVASASGVHSGLVVGFITFHYYKHLGKTPNRSLERFKNATFSDERVRQVVVDTTTAFFLSLSCAASVHLSTSAAGAELSSWHEKFSRPTGHQPYFPNAFFGRLSNFHDFQITPGQHRLRML